MNDKEFDSQALLAEIDQHFIDVVGPIGQLLAEDAKTLWRRKQWKGPSALRNYLKVLTAQIESKSDREQFIQITSQTIMERAAKQRRAL